MRKQYAFSKKSLIEAVSFFIDTSDKSTRFVWQYFGFTVPQGEYYPDLPASYVPSTADRVESLWSELRASDEYKAATVRVQNCIRQAVVSIRKKLHYKQDKSGNRTAIVPTKRNPTHTQKTGKVSQSDSVETQSDSVETQAEKVKTFLNWQAELQAFIEKWHGNGLPEVIEKNLIALRISGSKQASITKH